LLVLTKILPLLLLVLTKMLPLLAVVVGIRPRINYMKLNEHTQRLLFIAKRAYRTL
jgi:hypothetical protein